MSILVLGSNGMLGRYVYTYLKQSFSNVIGLTRKDVDASRITDNIPLVIKNDDVVINCIGVIPQRGITEPMTYIMVNSLFPHVVSGMCNTVRAKFIHVSTDCVFSGTVGEYTEDSVHDATDLYGRTKSLGEPSNATIIRTSIIGEELLNKKSLLEWVRSNKGGVVQGYANHHWNGVTCHTLAKIIEHIITTRSFWSGVKHIHSPAPLSKYNLITTINEVYDLGIKVNPVLTHNSCDKTLKSIKPPLGMSIPEIHDQVVAQREYGLLGLLLS